MRGRKVLQFPNCVQAYKKKVLECHPDKNPPDPDSAKMFHLISKGLVVLSDEESRKAYDDYFFCETKTTAATSRSRSPMACGLQMVQDKTRKIYERFTKSKESETANNFSIEPECCHQNYDANCAVCTLRLLERSKVQLFS